MWLLEQSQAHSQAEHKTQERVRTSGGHSVGKGDGKSKDKDKGKSKGNKGDKGKKRSEAASDGGAKATQGGWALGQQGEEAPPFAARPKLVPKRAANTCNAEQFGQSAWDNVQSPLPLAKIPAPMKPRSRSGRLRQRFRNRKQAWRIGSGLISLINALHTGSMDTSKASHSYHLSETTREAQQLAQRSLLAEAALCARDRRIFFDRRPSVIARHGCTCKGFIVR